MNNLMELVSNSLLLKKNRSKSKVAANHYTNYSYTIFVLYY